MQHANCWKGDLAERYKPLKESKSRAGKKATNEQLMKIIETAKKNEYWQLSMYCAAVAAGTGCRSWEIKNLQLQHIRIAEGQLLRPPRDREELERARASPNGAG
jgi:integrase